MGLVLVVKGINYVGGYMSLHLLNKQLEMKSCCFFFSVFVIRLYCIYIITFEELVYSVVGELRNLCSGIDFLFSVTKKL